MVLNGQHFQDCIGCTNRFVGCHSVCERYLTAKKEHEELKDRVRFNKKIDTEVDAFFIDGKRRKK